MYAYLRWIAPSALTKPAADCHAILGLLPLAVALWLAAARERSLVKESRGAAAFLQTTTTELLGRGAGR